MKTIKINVPDGKRAEWVNGVLTLVDNKPKDVTERIKTFEDACEELGSEHPLVLEYKTITARCGGLTGDLLAYLKLRIIVAALNDGWTPQFTGDEKRYFPWFVIYTKEKYERMSKEEKSCVVLRGGHNSSAGAGIAFAYANNASLYSNAYCGYRMSFKSKELAEYAGEQFVDIWADFVFKPEN